MYRKLKQKYVILIIDVLTSKIVKELQIIFQKYIIENLKLALNPVNHIKNLCTKIKDKVDTLVVNNVV